jgi:hypothetical protein
MTNGEKLEQVFPDGICPFFKSWLDCEYKEPLTKINQDLTKNKSEIPTGSTTKNDLGVDAVSRQAINGYIDYILSHGMGKKKSFDFIKKFVANLPPQEPRWIPTSERLPEEDGEYFATVYDTDENYKYMDIAELEDGIWQYKDYIKVLAWMPLPQPHREVEA